MRVFLVIAFLVAACGGTGGSTTTGAGPGDAGTTTTNTEGDGSGGNDGGGGNFNLPQECVDAVIDFLKEIEPVVEGVDWDNATMADIDELGLDALSESYTDEVDALNCDDVDFEDDTDQAFDYLIDLARDNAPGTVGYLEWIRDFADSFGSGGDGTQVSGDCETDIAAFQEIVDQGGTMADMTLAEISSVTTLLSAISLECAPERSAEFFGQADVTAFLETG